MARQNQTATETVNELGAVWSADVDWYAAGEIGAHQVRCVLCGQAPCACPPFGTLEYVALVDQRHGRGRS